MANTLERLKQKFKSREERESVVGTTDSSADDPLSQRLYSLCFKLDPTVQSTETERCESIKELASLAQTVDLSAELQDLWQLIEPFASTTGPKQTRHAAIQFLRACVLSQHASGDLFRLSLFRTIVSDEWGRQDFDIRLRMLRELTNDGRDLREVEQEIGDKLSLWLDALANSNLPEGVTEARAANAPPLSSFDLLTSSYRTADLVSIRELLALVVNVVKFSFICLQETQITDLLRAACSIAARTTDAEVIHAVMLLLDAIVRYGTVPLAALSSVTRTLSFAVNMNDSSQEAWQIMRNLLKSHRARHTMAELFRIVDPSSEKPATSVLQVRGAVFIISMANWGSQKVKSLSYSFRYLLPCLQQATQLEEDMVDTEILLSLQQLISEYRENLSVLEWEAIADILAGMSGHWDPREPPKTRTLMDLPEKSAKVSLTPKPLFFELFNDILRSLRSSFLDQAGAVTPWFSNVLFRLGPWLSETTVLQFIEQSCNVAYYPSFADWTAALLKLIETFYISDTRTAIRSRMLRLVEDRYTPASLIEQEDMFDSVILPIIKNLPRESHPLIFTETLDFLKSVARDCGQKQFVAIVEGLVQCALNTESDAIASVLMLAELLSAMAAQAAVAVFEICATERGGEGCLLIYKYLVRIPTFHKAPRPVRLACIKYLLGMRSNANYRIYIPSSATPTNAETEFKGKAGSVQSPGEDKPEIPTGERTRLCLSLSCFSKTRNETDDAGPSGRSSQKELLSPTVNTPSTCLIPVAQHAAAVMVNLTREKDWEVYSCILQGLSTQLLNLPFFQAAGPQLTVLRAFFCDLIVNERAAATVKNLPTTVRKSDIYLTALNILTSLLAYRQFFTKQDQDEMLTAFQTGLYRWPSAAKNCMHAFTLALLELPQSMTKLLPGTLLKVSQMMSTAMAVHNLEFLATLAHLPSLRVNFTDTDLKRVFVIALQYINTTVSSPATPSSPLSLYIVQLAYQVLLAWFITLKLPERKKYVPFIIHYLLLGSNRTSSVLDENVELVLDMLIHNSFADCWSKPADSGKSQTDKSTKLPSRTWAQGNSLLTSQVSSQPGWINVTIRRPSGVVSLSMRLENPLKFTTAPIQQLEAPVVFEQVMRQRRSSAGKKDRFGEEGPPRFERAKDDMSLSQSPSFSQLKDNAISAIRSRDDTQSIDPGFVLAQFITYPNLEYNEPSILLPEDDVLTRGLSVLDRTPVVDLHKIGVVYVGPGQTTESEILSNTHGSRAYGYFLQSIGRLVRLKGCRDVYTGGLDTAEDFDGRHGLYAQDDLSQVIFHVVTLMPTLSHDPLGTSKKRHIGNDFVTIVWNESGQDYAFDTIPAQFNFVIIIIEPAAPGSAAYEHQKGSDAFHNQFFKVYAKHKAEMPEHGPLCEPKLISGACLASFVRQSAMHSNIFSQIFQHSGSDDSHTSNARERLRQIKRIKGRALNIAGPNKGTPSDNNIANAQGGGHVAPVDEREFRLDFTRFT
ncbi:hypothetical protein DFJ77DRAFT_485057 [Powellomyces hirtus]|nr:hypothetical protein DFJ77DRAFT_485057 [Powellomyces hirtus]